MIEALSIAELAAALVSKVNLEGDTGASSDLIQLAITFVNVLADSHLKPPEDDVLGALVRNYAIRPEDVNVFDCITRAAGAAAGAGFFFMPATGSLIAAKVGLVTAIASFVRDLRNKGTFLLSLVLFHQPRSALLREPQVDESRIRWSGESVGSDQRK